MKILSKNKRKVAQVYQSRYPLFISCQLSSNNSYDKFKRVNNFQSNIDLKALNNFIRENEELIGISFYGSCDNFNFMNDLLEYCQSKKISIFVDTDLNRREILSWYPFFKYINGIMTCPRFMYHGEL